MSSLVIVLGAIILAFTVFAITLAWADHATNRPARPRLAQSKASARRPEAAVAGMSG